MVLGTQTLFAVFKRTGGKVWKIRKVIFSDIFLEITHISALFLPVSRERSSPGRFVRGPLRF